MADNVLIHDSADRVPPPPPGRHPLTPISGADFPAPARRRTPVQVWILGSAVVVIICVWLLYRLDEALRNLFWRLPWLGDGLLLFGLAVAVLGAVGSLLTLGMRAWGSACSSYGLYGHAWAHHKMWCRSCARTRIRPSSRRLHWSWSGHALLSIRT
jgi:hypothetical protein